MKLFVIFLAWMSLLPVTAWAKMAWTLPVLNDASVTLTLSTTANALHIEHPLHATLTLTSPANEHPLAFQITASHTHGFTDIQSFEVASDVLAGERTTTWRYRIMLNATGPWRIDPFILTLENERTKATRQLLIKGLQFPDPTPLPKVEGDPQYIPTPENVPFGWRDAWLWANDHRRLLGGGLLLILLAVTARYWLMPILRRLKERTLPPEKRAALEFERLQAQHLLQAGEVKRYFYELTGIVRRYFERAYALRATRQTTEEFIAQLSQILPQEVATWQPMQAFLQAADVVKFAGQQTPVELAEQATSDAQSFIDYDTQERLKRRKQQKDAHV